MVTWTPGGKAPIVTGLSRHLVLPASSDPSLEHSQQNRRSSSECLRKTLVYYFSDLVISYVNETVIFRWIFYSGCHDTERCNHIVRSRSVEIFLGGILRPELTPPCPLMFRPFSCSVTRVMTKFTIRGCTNIDLSDLIYHSTYHMFWDCFNLYTNKTQLFFFKAKTWTIFSFHERKKKIHPMTWFLPGKKNYTEQLSGRLASLGIMDTPGWITSNITALWYWKA